MSNPRRWCVPIALGDLNMDATIEIDRHGNVALQMPNAEIGPDTLTPLEAAQLAQALQEASRSAAQMAKRGRR
jgi:hypothetical protein